MGAFVVLLILTIVDMLVNVWQSYLERKQPYRILVLSQRDVSATRVLQVLSVYAIYHVDSQSLMQFQSLSKDYDIVLVAGAVEKSFLQQIADAARIQ